nr:Na+/H+ antiporter NhaC family protein [Clostridia bacterium]
NMLIGLILGIVCQFILYIPKKLMTINGFFDSLFSGASSMLPLLMVIFFGFLLNACNERLGLFDLVIRLAGSAIPAWLLPLVTFILVGALVFATGSCWLIMLLTVPIFIPLSSELGADPLLVLSALLSGIGLGYSTCFYGDTIFLTAAGTEVNNMTIIRASLPYALIAAFISAAGYIAFGALM